MDIEELKKCEKPVSLEDLPSLVFILKEVCNVHHNTIRAATKSMLMGCLFGVTLTWFQFQSAGFMGTSLDYSSTNLFVNTQSYSLQC